MRRRGPSRRPAGTGAVRRAAVPEQGKPGGGETGLAAAFQVAAGALRALRAPLALTAALTVYAARRILY
ncbi:hypothetical protein ACFV9P_23040 [Streptomyces sp. NPDC059892]|uniref:hypothetical protein n=1 Tax=Streptomyces sp. NPDC059892 TaxID=3346989 RepID=UPI0036648A6E